VCACVARRAVDVGRNHKVDVAAMCTALTLVVRVALFSFVMGCMLESRMTCLLNITMRLRVVTSSLHLQARMTLFNMGVGSITK